MTLDEQIKQQKLMEEENKRKKTLIEQTLNDRLFLSYGHNIILLTL